LFRYLSAIFLLALASPCWGQSYVQSDLIDGPKAVAVGELFMVKVQGDLPYKLDPEPVSVNETLDRKGNLLLLMVVSEPGELKITVDYRVVHPTEEELSKAPTVPDPKDAAQVKAFKDYFKVHSDDELYHDLHTVKVGDDPGPVPPVPPKPPDDPQARKVYDAALANKLPATECHTVASNMRAVIAQAVATSMTLEEIQQDIKKRNEPITANKPHWDAWEKMLAGIFTVTSKEQAVVAYERIAEGLGTVK
jgi:hypothetical protein